MQSKLSQLEEFAQYVQTIYAINSDYCHKL